MSRGASHVCPHAGCPNLQPCQQHQRPKNARWSRNRDGAAQNRFRAQVLARDGHRCTRCGSTVELVAHHVTQGYDPACGVTLCRGCHRAVDGYAR